MGEGWGVGAKIKIQEIKKLKNAKAGNCEGGQTFARLCNGYFKDSSSQQSLRKHYGVVSDKTCRDPLRGDCDGEEGIDIYALYAKVK